MSKIIAIIGVTGTQGSSVANTFLRLPEWNVRGLTRNPAGNAAKALAAKGVEIVKADMDDKQSLISAFEGAHVIFSNADFFAHVLGAITSNVDLKGRTLTQYGYDREVEQGMNTAEAAASPSVMKTLERFVVSSLSEARKWSHGKYIVYHNDCKAEVIARIRSQLPQLAARMSAVHLAQFVETWRISPQLAPQKQPDGSYVIKRTFSPDFKMPFVVASQDTGSFVKALVDLPAGKSIEGLSEAMTWPEYTKLWGDTMGVKATFKHVSDDEYFEGMPESLKEELSTAFKYMEEYWHTGGDPEILSAEQLGIKVPVTPVKEFIKTEDWSSVL